MRRNVVAYVALFFALGGVGYAAVKIPRNSVGTAQLKRNAVTSSKVKNGSLTAADFVKGLIKAGPAGPQGPTGPTGPTGPAGPGAKLLQADPAPLSTLTPTALGAAGPWTLEYSCQKNPSGDVSVVPAVSGPAGHLDLTSILDDGSGNPPIVGGVDLPSASASSPAQLGPSVTATASHGQSAFSVTLRLTGGGGAVDVQMWGIASVAGGGHPAACHISASVLQVTA